MRSLWNALLDSMAPHAAEAAPARKKGRLEFERLETRENPAAMSDAVVWGQSWQEYHVGSDNHFHIQYSANGGPVQDVDLTAALASNASFNEGNAPVVATTFGNNPYVFVRAGSGDMHAFYWNGSAWGEANLSAAAGYTKDVQPRQFAAHVWNGVPHVFFLGTDKHVHEIFWTANTGWKGFDVSVASGTGALAQTKGLLTGLVANDGTERVYYTDSNYRVRELKWAGASGWSDSSTGGPSVFSASREISAVAVGNGVNVYCQRGSDGHLYQLANAGGGWTSTDVTEAAGAKIPHDYFSVQAYVLDGKINVFYASYDAELHRLQWSPTNGGGWTDANLSVLTGAPDVQVNDANPEVRDGNITTLVSGGTEVVFYLGKNGRTNRMFHWGDPLFGWAYANGPIF